MNTDALFPPPCPWLIQPEVLNYPRHGGRCGRPLRTNPAKRCQLGCQGYVPSCTIHMTPEEKATVAGIEARLSARLDAMEPVCWAWPVPAEVPTFGTDWRGLSDAADFIHEWQRHYCAICGDPHSRTVDHDHYTGLIRGILCGGCNRAEGSSGHPIYQKYRERHPASMLGIYAQCDDPDSARAPFGCLTKEVRSGIRDAVDRMHIAIPAPPDEEAAL